MVIPTIFYKPHQATPQDKVPALVWVHGGPGGQTRSHTAPSIQYLVNHGYAVLGINNRGSSGYGKTFFTADDRKHGREPLRDCVEAKKYLPRCRTSTPTASASSAAATAATWCSRRWRSSPRSSRSASTSSASSNWLRTLESIPP